MNLLISPSRPTGTVAVPPSKSMAHRLLICAALADGESTVRGVELSEDIAATCDCLRAMGAQIRFDGDRVTVRGVAGKPRPTGLLPCRESGSTLRFLIPLCLTGETVTLSGSERLMQRPLSVYEDLFSRQGIAFSQEETSLTLCGRLSGGTLSVRGDVSSQFLTGLLFALPLLEGESRIVCTTPIESRSYLDLTLSALSAFGISVLAEEGNGFVIPGAQRYLPQDVSVEGDESNAAFFGALGTVYGSVGLSGRNPDTLQGDRVWETYFPLLAKQSRVLSVRDCPDLAPVLMTVGAFFHGVTLTDTRRLSLKESDRGTVMAEELAKFGVRVSVEENFIRVFPGVRFAPKQPLDGHNDHRVVMALALLCTRYGGVIEGAQAVRKSYPSFFDDLRSLTVGVSEL